MGTSYLNDTECAVLSIIHEHGTADQRDILQVA